MEPTKQGNKYYQSPPQIVQFVIIHSLTNNIELTKRTFLSIK